MEIISVHGDIDKVENLLQGQITSDIKLLGNENFQLSSICNQKGEVMAGFIIYKLLGLKKFGRIPLLTANPSGKSTSMPTTFVCS